MESQNSIILAALKAGRRLTDKTAEELCGTRRFGARICDLRQRGYRIGDVWREGKSMTGRRTKYKEYFLIEGDK